MCHKSDVPVSPSHGRHQKRHGSCTKRFLTRAYARRPISPRHFAAAALMNAVNRLRALSALTPLNGTRPLGSRRALRTRERVAAVVLFAFVLVAVVGAH